MRPFHKVITELITGQKAVQVMTMYWWWTAIKVGASLFGAYKSYTGNKAAGEASYNAAYQNSANLLHYAGLNSELMMGAAARNAEAILKIGEANAAAIERANARNMGLYRIQAEEEVRRHVIGEKMKAGEIRAVSGSSGLMVNTGTPAAYLESQVYEGITQRNYMKFKHAQTLIAMEGNASDEAAVYRLTASENAAVVMSNAEAQTGVMMNNTLREYEAMRLNGSMAQQQYNSQAWGGLWSGLGSAAIMGVDAFRSWNAAQPASTQPFNSLSAPPTVAQNTPPAGITAPGYAGYQPYDPSWRYTGNLPSWYGNQ